MGIERRRSVKEDNWQRRSWKNWSWIKCPRGRPSRRSRGCESTSTAPNYSLLAKASLRASLSVHAVHDDNKDGNFELEMAWISKSETEGYLRPVPVELQQEAEAAARAALEEVMEED